MPYSIVGTLRTVPGPFVQVLGHLALSQDLFVLVLGHFTLSQDLSFKCWDTSHCPNTSCSSVGTLRTVTTPLAQVLGLLTLSQDLPVLMLGHFVLSQGLSFKCRATSYCPKTSCSSVGTLHTVPKPPAQVLGQSDLLFFGTVGSLVLRCWDSRISCSLALRHLDHYPRYHHLSSSIKYSPSKPNLVNQKFYLPAFVKLPSPYQPNASRNTICW